MSDIPVDAQSNYSRKKHKHERETGIENNRAGIYLELHSLFHKAREQQYQGRDRDSVDGKKEGSGLRIIPREGLRSIAEQAAETNEKDFEQA